MSIPTIAVFRFRVDLETPCPRHIEIYRGEDALIRADLYQQNERVEIPAGATVRFYWQTASMREENQWWIVEGEVTDGAAQVAWRPTMDSGAEGYQWFLAVEDDAPEDMAEDAEDADSLVCLRACGDITMAHGPGRANEIPLPTPVIDFATVEVLNPPWPAEIEAEAVARAEADRSLGNRVDTVSAGLADKADKVTGATADDFAALDAAGNLTDSGKKATDFAAAAALANKVPRNGDTGLTGNYGTTGSITSSGYIPSGHVSPMSVGMNGGYGDLTVASLEEDPTHAVPPENLKLWMANIYADRIERFDGDTGQGAVTHRFPAGDGTLALVSQIPSVTGKADKVANATAGNFAGLDAAGNLTDSGKKATDFATPADLPAAETWTFEVDDGQGGTTTVTKSVAVYPTQAGA